MKNDFIIYYEKDVEEDSEILKTLLSNLHFSVNKLGISGIPQDNNSFQEATKNKSIPIFLSSPKNDKAKYSGLINKINPDFYLHLEKSKQNSSPEERQTLSENYLQFEELKGNNKLARMLLKIISDSDLLIESNFQENRFGDYQNTINVYSESEFSNSYFNKWKDKMPQEKLDFFSSLLEPNAKVLDAGCGPGHHSNYLSKKGFKINGIDLSPISIEIAKKYALPNTEFLVRDTLESGLASNSVQGIWSCSAAIHFPQDLLRKQLKEFSRIIDKDGIIAITMAIGQRQHSDGFGRFFESYRNTKVVQQMIKEEGFEMIKTDDEITWSSTQGDLRITNWVTFYSKYSKL